MYPQRSLASAFLRAACISELSPPRVALCRPTREPRNPQIALIGFKKSALTRNGEMGKTD
jgi:hypothetical protein